jgi:hypothetical protein
MTPRWARNLDGNAMPLSPEGPWQGSSQVTDGEASAGTETSGEGVLLGKSQRPQSDDSALGGALIFAGPNVQDNTDAMMLDRPPDTLAWYVRSAFLVPDCSSKLICARRLLSHSLPTTRNLRRIVEHYFANVHPLRCFAFIHKPSFMRQLDHGFESDDESALLHIVCAQGAKWVGPG